MNPKEQSSERGQALILIVLALIVLLGFTALAIDGSMLYSDRRYVQNVADAAALSAAGKAALSLENDQIDYDNWVCGRAEINAAEGIAEAAAIDRAADNDITNGFDFDISDGHGVVAACGVDNSESPPDQFIDITVQITFDTNTNFAHLLYPGSLTNTVEAVARVRPRETSIVGGGDVAIMGLKPDSDPNDGDPECNDSTVKFHGDSLVDIRGGDVHSNACVRFNGTPDVDLTIDDPFENYVYYVSDRFGNEHSNPLERVTNTTYDPIDFYIPVPDCASQPARSVPNGGGNLLPGRYPDMRFNGPGDYTMEPGLYCVIDEIVWNGDSVTGNGVTIVVETGGVTISGGFASNLYAPAYDADPASVAPAVPGLLFYLPETNNSTVTLAGNLSTRFEGVVLAPSSLVMIEGTGANLSYHVMIVGWQVDVGGDAKTVIKHYPNNLFIHSRPTRMELHR